MRCFGGAIAAFPAIGDGARTVHRNGVGKVERRGTCAGVPHRVDDDIGTRDGGGGGDGREGGGGLFVGLFVSVLVGVGVGPTKVRTKSLLL